jgi:glutamine synthetase
MAVTWLWHDVAMSPESAKPHEEQMSKQQEFVLRTVEERDIRFIRLWFTDILGTLKSVAIAPAELENAFEEGIGFDGSAIEGFARQSESDMLAKPDPATFTILPWRAEAQGAARMFCDITLPSGQASPADPRNVLRRTLAKASQMGYTCYTHPEIEFFLFTSQPEKGVAPVPVDQGGYFDHTPAVVGHDFRRQAITLLEAMGVSVEFSHHEGAPGQQEIDLRDADALSTADNIMTFRHVIKEVALNQGFFASFMPKPFTEYPGSGMHTHVSLFDGEKNAFYDEKAELNLSPVGRQFIAGILKHAAEITAVTNQWVNSYKRLQGGGEAPSIINWGHNDRGALVRIPMYKPNKENSTRIEFRSPDSACNPYLAYAVMLAAGLKGIENKYVLAPSTDTQSLPSNLEEAITVMEQSELVRETLGEHVFEYFLRNKRAEWQDYRRQVSAYELDRYLPVL